MANEIKWVFVQTMENGSTWCDEYESEDGRYCKQVWNDGFEEVFEIAGDSDDYDYDEDIESGFDPYCGCYTDDC